MRDMHCHILPGVDDGAEDLEESLCMLEAARQIGVTEIVCTPHCRDPYFDYDAMWDAYELLAAHADGIALHMGFEVNVEKFCELGFGWMDHLAFNDSDEFLLELRTHATPQDFLEYQRVIYEIQAAGYRVVIAHPERYLAVQGNLDIAADLVRMGCELQVSADFLNGGRFGREKAPAKSLLRRGLCAHIASDAHCANDYHAYANAMRRYGSLLESVGSAASIMGGVAL